MAGWESFLVAEVGASAALAGLIFVALSLNLTKILAYPTLPLRALEALAVLLTTLVVATLLLVPGQRVAFAGWETLAVGVCSWAALSLLNVRGWSKLGAEERSRVWPHLILIQIATVPLIVAGDILLTRGAGGMYWIVPSVIGSFLVAFINAWILMLEINR